MFITDSDMFFYDYQKKDIPKSKPTTITFYTI